MKKNNAYEKLITAITSTGLHTTKGLRYLLDLSTRLQLWHEGYRDFMRLFGDDYASVCLAYADAGEAAITRMQSDFKANLLQEYDDLTLSYDRRLLAAWCLYIIAPEQPITLDKLKSLMTNWMFGLQQKNISLTSFLEQVFTIDVTVMNAETYVNRVIIPAVLAADAANPPVHLELISLLKQKQKKDVISIRILSTIEQMVRRFGFSKQQGLDFLTRVPELNTGSIVVAIAKHHKKEINITLQKLIISLRSNDVTITEIVKQVCHYTQNEENSYATQLAEQGLKAECTELLGWVQEAIQSQNKDCLSSVLPSNFLKTVIEFNDSVIYKKLLTIFVDLLKNPDITNEEFLRLNKSFKLFKSALQSDLTQQEKLQDELEKKTEELKRYVTLHNLERRRVRFDGAFAIDLREMCLAILRNSLEDISEFESYLRKRIVSDKLDAAGKTICEIFLQCIYNAALSNLKKQNHEIQKYLKAKKDAETDADEMPEIFLPLSHAVQESIRLILLDSENNLREFHKVLRGYDVERVSPDVRNVYSLIFAAFESDFKSRVFINNLIGVVVRQLCKLQTRHILQEPPPQALEPMYIENLGLELVNFKLRCQEGQEKLIELFSSIQNNYPTYPDFVLALLNMTNSVAIWYPAVLALATVDRQLFKKLFTRALDETRTFPIAAESMLIAAKLLFKDKKFDEEYYKQLFLDVNGAPHRFTFEIAEEKTPQVKLQWLASLELLNQNFDPVVYFSKLPLFSKNLLTVFFDYCSSTECKKMLALMQRFLTTSKLESKKAIELYALLEECNLDMGHFSALRATRHEVRNFLKRNMLIRMHYYIESRSSEGIDDNFEKRLRCFLNFLSTGKVGDLTPFKAWGHSKRFNTYISAVMRFDDEIIDKARLSYRLFLNARVEDKHNRYGYLDISVQIINRRILLALLPKGAEYKARSEKLASDMENYCKNYTDQLQNELPNKFNSSLIGMYWLASFSNYAKHVIATHVSNNQPYESQSVYRFFQQLPTPLEQKQLTTRCLWEDYIKAKQSGGDYSLQMKQLCDWLNRGCTDIRQRLKSNERDEIYPCLRSLINVDVVPQSYNTPPQVLLEHYELTLELTKVIVGLFPEIRESYTHLLRLLTETVQLRDDDAEPIAVPGQ